MKLIVKLFAAAREASGTEQIRLDLPDSGTVADLRSQLVAVLPELQNLAPSLLVAVNSQYAADSVQLSESDDVACFPPVSGG